MMRTRRAARAAAMEGEPPPSRDNMSGGSPLQERTNLLRAEEDDDVRMVQTKTTSRSKKKEEGEDRECGVQDAASRAKEVVEGKTWSEKRVRSACDGLTSALANREAEEKKQTLPVGSQAREALLGYLYAALRVEEREIGRRKLSEESLSAAWRAASAALDAVQAMEPSVLSTPLHRLCEDRYALALCYHRRGMVEECASECAAVLDAAASLAEGKTGSATAEAAICSLLRALDRLASSAPGAPPCATALGAARHCVRASGWLRAIPDDDARRARSSSLRLLCCKSVRAIAGRSEPWDADCLKHLAHGAIAGSADAREAAQLPSLVRRACEGRGASATAAAMEVAMEAAVIAPQESFPVGATRTAVAAAVACEWARQAGGRQAPPATAAAMAAGGGLGVALAAATGAPAAGCKDEDLRRRLEAWRRTLREAACGSDLGSKDGATRVAVLGAAVRAVDGFRGTHAAGRPGLAATAGDEGEVWAALSVLESPASLVAAMAAAGAPEADLRRAFTTAAASLVAAQGLRTSWVLQGGSHEPDAVEFPRVPAGLNPALVFDQTSWAAKSCYNLAVEALGASHPKRAASALQAAMVALLAASGAKQHQAEDLALFGVRVSEAALRASGARVWALFVARLAPLVSRHPAAVSRLARGASHASKLAAAAAAEEEEVNPAAIGSSLLETGSRESVGLALMLADAGVLGDEAPGEVPEGRRWADCPRDELPHLAVASAIRRVLACRGEGGADEGRGGCEDAIAAVTGALQALGPGADEGGGEEAPPERAQRTGLLARVKYDLAAMGMHLDRVSSAAEGGRQDGSGAEGWAGHAMAAALGWESCLELVEEMGGEEAEAVSRSLGGSAAAAAALGHMRCEAAFHGHVELLERAAAAACGWACLERGGGDTASIFASSLAGAPLLEACSVGVSPRSILGAIAAASRPLEAVAARGAISAFAGLVLGPLDPAGDDEENLPAAAAVNAALAKEQGCRPLRAALQLHLAALCHSRGRVGEALAHALEAARLTTGMIKSRQGQGQTQGQKCAFRNLHCLCLLYCGDLRLRSGAPSDACRSYQEVKLVADAGGSTWLARCASRRLCRAYCARGEPGRAREQLGGGGGDRGMPEGVATSLADAEDSLCEGIALAAEGDVAGAERAFARARRSLPAADSPQRDLLHWEIELELAECLALAGRRREAEDALGGLQEAMEKNRPKDGAFGARSRLLLLRAALVSTRDAAVCRLTFEEGPEAREGEAAGLLAEAVMAAAAAPLHRCRASRLLSLVLSPESPSEALSHAHASIGVSYDLQGSCVRRTSFLRRHFAGTQTQEAPPEPEISCRGPTVTAEAGGAARKALPRGAALCALCLVPPSEAAGIVGEGGATLLISRQAREGRAVSAALTLGQRDANFPRDLSEILTRSNAAVTASWDFSDKQQTKEWWRRRLGLDQELSALLRRVDESALGPGAVFLMGEPTAMAAKLSSEVRAACPHGVGEDAASPLSLVLLHARTFGAAAVRDQIAYCLSCEEREGLDLDELASAFVSRSEALPPLRRFKPGPVLLALDGRCQPFPWESLPRLRGQQEVCRVPSLRHVLWWRGRAKRGEGGGEDVDWRSAYFLLNPSGDLVGTQGRFEAWFADLDGWRGHSGEPPTCSDEVERMLRAKDAFVYFGHGTGERYVTRSTVERLDRCPAAFLMGCSSARLAPTAGGQGGGFLLSYLAAGSPLCVGNLWDVTDKDIDRLAKKVLESCVGGGEATRLTASTLEDARRACKLPALTGGSPVFYGLPTSVLEAWASGE